MRSWFIYELQKSTTNYTLLLQKYHLWNPPYAFRFPIIDTRIPSELHNCEPPSPSEILKAVCGISMDIFWNCPLLFTVIVNTLTTVKT